MRPRPKRRGMQPASGPGSRVSTSTIFDILLPPTSWLRELMCASQRNKWVCREERHEFTLCPCSHLELIAAINRLPRIAFEMPDYRTWARNGYGRIEQTNNPVAVQSGRVA